MSTIDKLNLKDSTTNAILDLRGVSQINELRLNTIDGSVFEGLNNAVQSYYSNHPSAPKVTNYKFRWIQEVHPQTLSVQGLSWQIKDGELSITGSQNNVTSYGDLIPLTNKVKKTHKYLLYAPGLSGLSFTLRSPENFWRHDFRTEGTWKIFISNYDSDYNRLDGDFMAPASMQNINVRSAIYFIDLTEMEIDTEINHLDDFLALFPWIQESSVAYIDDYYRSLYCDSQGIVRNHMHGTLPPIRLHCNPPALVGDISNIPYHILVPDVQYENYIRGTNWKNLWSALLYSRIEEIFQLSIEKHGSPLYDGASKILQGWNVALYPDSMKYWLGYGKCSHATNPDGSPLYTIEPEDYLDPEMDFEMIYPDTCPDEDKVYSRLGDNKDNGLVECMYNNSVSTKPNKVYNWELMDLTELPDRIFENKNMLVFPFERAISMKTIGERAFYGCVGITEVTIPDSLLSIGRSAFTGCLNILRMNISSLESWLKVITPSRSGLPNTPGITNGQKTPGFQVYINGIVESNIVIPQSISAIYQGACMGWGQLTSVQFHSGVVELQGAAFRECENITEFDLSMTQITRLQKEVFYGCRSCVSISLPATIESISDIAFYCGDSLTRVNVSDLNAFYKAVVKGGYTSGIYYGNPNVTLYHNNQPITSIELPNDVGVSVNAGLTYGANTVRRIVIPDTVINIGGDMISSMSALQVAVFGSSIAYIGASFGAKPIPSLRYLVMKPVVPPVTSSIQFMQSAPSSLEIYVPVNSKSSYSSDSVWSSVSSKIKEYNMECDPLGIISDNGPRACYCPMSNLDKISSANYNTGLFTAVAGTPAGTQVEMRIYDSDGEYTTATWTVKSNGSITA